MTHQTLTAEWAVAQMVANDCTFSEIEDYIAELPLGSASKLVLWLWAWAEQPRILRHELIPLDRQGARSSRPPPRPRSGPPSHPKPKSPLPLATVSFGGLLRLNGEPDADY